MSLGALGNPAVQALATNVVANVLTNSVPRAIARYWWLGIPVGYVAWEAYRERKKKGTLSVYGMVADVTPMVTLAASLVLLNDCLDRRQAAPPAAAPAPAQPVSGIDPSKIRDAAFTEMQQTRLPAKV